MIMQFLVGFTFIVLVQSVIYSLFAFRGFNYSCTLSHNRVNEGETIEYTETIENKRLLPLLWLKVEARFNETLLFTKNDNTRVSAGTFHRSVLSMPPFRRIKRTYKIVCSKRGYYPLGSSSITTGDLLGLTSRTMSFSSDMGLHVFPVPLSQTQIDLPSRSFLGDMVVRRYILPDPFMPAGVRDYVPGDPQNMIHWKASAKTGSLVVHRREFTADSKLLVFFNVAFNARSWDINDTVVINTMENSLRILATVFNLAASNGQQTALCTNSISFRDRSEVTVPPAYGRAHNEKLFSAMAEMQFIRTRSFHMLLREAVEEVRDMDILLVTRYISAETQTEIEALRLNGNKVEVFIIPEAAAEHLPDGGEQNG